MSKAFTVVVVMLLAVSGAVHAAARPVPVAPGAAAPSGFEASNACGCHAALVEQWSGSMHAKALDDPLYKTKVEEAQRATKGKIGAFCNKCHGPIATMTREIEKTSFGGASAEGVACMFCHQATALAGKPGNTAHLVDPTGIRRAQIRDPEAPHPAQYSPFHESAELCGGCHNVDHPVNGMHLESTYTEWKESPYAQEGIVCQDCHMSREPGVVGSFRGQAAGGSPERDGMYRMSFSGAQVALGDAGLATAMLQSAAVVTIEAPDVVDEGREARVVVDVENKGAGHYLPTGLTEVREMWLEVFALGDDGKRVEIGEHRFGTILKDAQGKYPVELWDAVAVQSDDRIPPRQTVTREYDFVMPAGLDSVQIEAELLYRSAPEEFAKKAGVDNPTTKMASARQAVYSSEGAKEKGDGRREQGSGEGWNLLVAAIGLLFILSLPVVFIALGRRR